MLRRTRANQVVPVFQLVSAKYPTPSVLATAPAEQVSVDFKSLGLYWRIAQFQTTATELHDRHGGQVPCDRQELLDLTGVSEYVADAVLVFGCDQPRAVLDANVARVLARYFGHRHHAEARRDRHIRETADALLPKKEARDYNFAMLDLAALVCTPQSPKHEICPLRRSCYTARLARA